MEDFLEKKIIIANKLSLLLAGFFFTISCIMAFRFALYTNTGILLLLVVILLAIPRFNNSKYSNATRIFLSLILPLFIYAASITVKIHHPFGKEIVFYILPQIALAITVLVPLLVLDIRKTWQFYFPLVFYALCILLYIQVHEWLGLGIEQAAISYHSHFLATVIPLLAMIIIAAAFIFMQKLNMDYEQSLLANSRQIKESEKKFRSVFNYATDLMFLVEVNNEDRLIREVNNTALLALGYLREELINSHYDDLVNEEAKRKIKDRESRVMAGQSLTYESAHRRKDGSEFPVEVSARKMTIGNKVFIYRVERDISERKHHEEALTKAKEEAEQSDRLKSAFLANMSHEIRTPINGILGFASLLKEPNLSDEQVQSYLGIINNCGNHLLNLINDIIDISKIESNQLTKSESDCHLNILLDEIRHFFQAMISNSDKSNLELKFNYSLDESQDLIVCDITRLRQILMNILNNAFKFTASGFIRLSYTVAEDNTLCFAIEDSGIGISDEQMSFIFEPFRQGDETATRKYGGTGLGLSISRACVKILGGKIWAKSKLGQGSTFYFTIPYNQGKTETDVIMIDDNQFNHQFSGKRILVVEDDFYNFLLLQKKLESKKIVILRAEDGLQAIELCQKRNDIDLVLMDVQLPRLDGLQASKQILSFRPHLPIIAQTANAMPDDERKTIAAGCVAYISKPIDMTKLFKLMANHLPNR